MKVYKFGGTSVGTPERMMQVAELIRQDDAQKIIVLSAVAGTTNALLEISNLYESGNIDGAQVSLKALKSKYIPFIEALFKSEKHLARGWKIIDSIFEEIKRLITQPFYKQITKIIIVQGELISSKLFDVYLSEIAPEKAKLLLAVDFVTLNKYQEPDISAIRTKLLKTLDVNPGFNLYITQGFICRNSAGGIDNLQRGGSDYSATLIGAAIGADEVQIWTDIDGMHNNDPRIVQHTKPISQLSFEEAGELAYFGAKILHPNCIIPAQQFGIPVLIKNTLKPQANGTLINSEQQQLQAVKAIAAKDNITAIKIKSTRMINAYGFLRKIFEIFEKHRTSIDMITTSEIAVSLTIDNSEKLHHILEEIKPFGKVEIDIDQTIICIVGDMVAENKGISSKVFSAVEEVPIRMISYGGSKNNISMLIDTQYKKLALTKLNERLFSL